jgi:hypothetical protein
MFSLFHRPRRSAQGHRIAGLGLCALMAATLVACGGGVPAEDEHDHDEVVINTAGRLAIAESGSATLRIWSLDDNAVEASHVLANPPSALYTSPGGRYAVAMQRTQDRVQFVDGGVWQEDHGDHLHDYRQGSRLMPWTLAGARPTHYDVQAGSQAAVFMDGNAAATPVQTAGVRLITDTSIAAGETLAGLDLPAPLHGLAEPMGDKLLAVERADDAPDTLPTHLALYQRSGSSYTRVRQLPTRCNGMHGSFSSGSSTLTGCSDGMLLVRHLGDTTVSDGSKLATALRVGTIAGHARAPDLFFGIASEGTAPGPVTTRFYAVDGAAATVTAFTPEGWTTGRVRRAHAFDRSGQHFAVLDDQGTLIVSERSASGWVAGTRVAGVIPAMPSAAPWPAIVANGARDELYITDPVARQLVVVDSHDGRVITRRELGYVPSAITWTGITR